MYAAQPPLELGHVLTLLKLGSHAALRPVLPVRERFERTVMLEHRHDLLDGSV
jgi:hypothetical protein